MIVTLTANTSLDLTLVVDDLSPHRTVRANQTILSMAGKPTDASFILGTLGIPSRAIGMASGAFGQRAAEMLAAKGVTVDFVEVGGDTRINVVLVRADGAGDTTITTNTLIAEEKHISELLHRLTAALHEATCVVMGGTLPNGMSPTFYSQAIGIARSANVPVILDASGENLQVGLCSNPDYAKPNRDELSDLAGYSIDSHHAAFSAASEILATYGTQSIVTLGGDGAVAVLKDRAYFIPPLQVNLISPAGAGDAVLAGLAAAIEKQQPIETGIRLGMAYAAAVCQQAGTAILDPLDVERFLPQVQLVPYP